MLEIEDFQSPKEGKCPQDKLSSPYIKSKEVKSQGAQKIGHKKTSKLLLFVPIVLLLRCRANASHLPCLAMREKIEMLKNLAESMLDELAEMEALLIEETTISENVDRGLSGN